MSKKLAILGGTPVCKENTYAGQPYLPHWERFADMTDGIFDRKYYTNHGPLLQKLEKELSAFLNVRHAICMTNTGIGLMIAAKALDLNGKVVLPAFSHVSLAQAMIWAGLEPVFCDVDKTNCTINAALLRGRIDGNTRAVLGVNLFGGTCDFKTIQHIASEFSIRHCYLSDDAVGEQYNGTHVGNFGDLQIFSLHESKLINAVDGCVVATNDDFTAARLRNIRSSYGSGPAVPIAFTGNGRMSEAQAGMGLLTLEDYPANVQLNKERAERYKRVLAGIDGIAAYEPGKEISARNYQNHVIRVDKAKFGMSASALAKVLRAERFVAGTFEQYAISPYPPFAPLADMAAAVELSASLLALPVGGKTINGVAPEAIGEVIREASANAERVNSLLMN
jgi:dTDP-4-amino-4,6-dideoxygalactose transaminase